jgi:hypothetical protein
MSYRDIKDYIVRRMNNLNYWEAKVKFDFSQSSDTNLDRVFIVQNTSGELAEGMTLADRFFPEKTMQVQVAFGLSENMVADYDKAGESVDFILRDLTNPAYWKEDLRLFTYQSHEIRQEADYLLAIITFTAQDRLIFT